MIIYREDILKGNEVSVRHAPCRLGHLIDAQEKIIVWVKEGLMTDLLRQGRNPQAIELWLVPVGDI